MRHLLTFVTRQARLPLHVQAVLVGAALGWVAWELSRVADRQPGFNLAMALVVIGSGSASFVLYALHVQAARKHTGPGEHGARARTCLSLLGCGLALSINTLALALT